MQITTFNYLLTAFFCVWIFLCKKPSRAFVPLFLSAFSGVPVYYFGNSSSGGIFPVDIAAIAFCVRYGLVYSGSFFVNLRRRKLQAPFIFLILWVIFSALHASTQNYYSEYYKFIYYGIGRWLTFCVYIVIFFGADITFEELIAIIRKLCLAFIIYGAFLLLHQNGFLDLSGVRGLGPRILTITENFYNEYDFKTMFLGANRACVGAICYTGFWIAILTYFVVVNNRKWRKLIFILGAFMILGILGVGSRSDAAGLSASFLFATMIAKGRSKGGMKKVYFIALLVLSCIGIVIAVFNIELSSPGYQRVFGAFNYETVKTSDRADIQKGVIEYIKTNPRILLTGLGPNCFRVLHAGDVVAVNFAHNSYLHILIELGMGGFLLIFWLFYRVVIVIKKSRIKENNKIKEAFYTILLAYIFGKLVTSYGVDVFFAVDAMLPSNIMLLGFMGLLISTNLDLDTKTNSQG